MTNNSAAATGPIPSGPESIHRLFEKFVNEGDHSQENSQPRHLSISERLRLM
jgi:hypothetical protein